MHISHQDLVLLETIDQTGSFTAAAEALNRTRSAITQAIKKLEDQVGFDIFDRTAYRPTFTEQGADLLKRAKPVIASMQMLKRDISLIRDGWGAEIAISYDDILDTTPLYDLIAEFQQVAPRVTITLHREVMNGCWDSLLEERAILTIGVTGEAPPGLAVHQMPIGSVDFVFVGAPTHPLVLKDDVSLKDVGQYPPVVIPDTSQRIGRGSSGILLSDTQILVPTMAEKIKAQLHGIGVGYLPHHLIQHHLDKGRLVMIPLKNQAPRRVPIKAAWLANHHSVALEWFVKNLASGGGWGTAA